MRLPRQHHHGHTIDGSSWQFLARGLLVLFAFTFLTASLQRTYDLVSRTRAAGRLEQEKLARLADLHQAQELAERSRAFYQSDAGLVAAARTYGYGLPGERRVMFEPPARRGEPEVLPVPVPVEDTVITPEAAPEPATDR